MSLTEETVIDQTTIDEYGNTSVRWATYVLRDGERDESFAPRYHRRAYAPDDDLEDAGKDHKLDARVKRVIAEARKGAKKRPSEDFGD